MISKRINKRSAQLKAYQLCDNEMPSDWVRTDLPSYTLLPSVIIEASGAILPKSAGG